MDNLFNLQGKTVLVTGSSQGLGAILAKGLAEVGARIVLNGRDEKKLDEARERFRSAGFEVFASPFDVTDSLASMEAIKTIENEFGPIDVLVNNAGIQYRAPLEDFPEEKWRMIIDTNLSGAFFTAKAVVPSMIKRGRGKIINICSLQSELGRATIAPYAAAKGGLKMLTRGMCVDWAKHNIQINSIGPGYFVTEMTQPLKDNEEFDRWICSRTPAGRWGNPEELVGTMIYLASAASDFVNGQLLFVDGGITAAI